MSNIIITNLSAWDARNSDRPMIEYKTYDERITAGGVRTNDAPVRCLMKEIALNNGTVDKILTLTTDKAKETAYDDFAEMVREYSAEINISAPVCESIHISEDGNDIPQTISEVVEKVSADDNVYVDTTGGFRNSSYLLMAVVRVLEFSDINVSRVIYSNYQTREIMDVADTYKMFDLINAVNSFTHTGNSRELQEYFKDSDNDTVKRTIKAMNTFSDELTLCRTSNLDSALRELNKCLEELAELQTDSRDIILFKTLSETIRKKFNVKNGNIEYPDIVKWCVDNNMIQQAVTIYVEKMPEYFYEKEYFSVRPEALEKIKKQNDKSVYDLCYELLYTHLVQNSALYMPCYIIKKIVDSSDMDKVGFAGNLNIKRSDEEFICTELAKCRNIGEFFYRINKRGGKIKEKYRLEEMRTVLSRYFNIKNAIYDKKGVKYKELREENLEKYPDVAELLAGLNLPNTPVGLLKTLATGNIRLLEAIFGEKSRYHNNHIKFIENIGNKDRISPDFDITEKLPPDELKSVFRDIYYLKIYVRNSLNHASDEKNNDEEMSEYFKEHGYNTDDEPSAAYISSVMNDVLNRIRFAAAYVQ